MSKHKTYLDDGVHKTYLGDGVYVDFDGYGLDMTTENGIDTTNRIYLEPQVLSALDKYVARIRGMYPDWVRR